MNIDLSGIQNTVVTTVATVILIVLIVRLVGAYFRRAWGEMVAEVVFVLVIGFFVWFPDAAETMLRTVTGGATGAA